VRVGREEQRVAVCRALGDHVGGDRALRARLVLDHERLLEGLPQLDAEHPCHEVGRASGGEGHDDLDGLVGIDG
jgi:hypothetical protein